MNKNLLISKISKKESKSLLEKYHYLSQESTSFRSGFNYGLFKDKQLIGVKKNDSKILDATLPANHPKKDLADKEAIFECKICLTTTSYTSLYSVISIVT